MADDIRPEIDPPLGSSDLLCRALARMESRRDWLKSRQANALYNERLLDAGGWQCRAGGVADAIDILKGIEEEARHNAEVRQPAGQIAKNLEG